MSSTILLLLILLVLVLTFNDNTIKVSLAVDNNSANNNNLDSTTSSYFVLVLNQRLSWQAAEQYCQTTYGTHLATVDTQDKLNDIYSLWKGIHFRVNLWIGLNDLAKQRSGDHDRVGWVWSSGSPYTTAQQAFWRHTQPDKTVGIENCVRFWKQRKTPGFDNAPCDRERFWSPFACDAPAVAG
jgi:hypothetical protein